MTIFKAKYTVDPPATNLLSYLFSSPYKAEGAWPTTEPLLVSTNPTDSRYTINEIKSFVKRIGHGLAALGVRGKKVIIYGDANIHFPLVVLGVVAAGATVNIRPQGAVQDLASRLRELECDIVLFGPSARETVVEAAGEVGVPGERLFVIDEFLDERHENGNGRSEDRVKNWSALLDEPEGDEYEWPELSPEESKSTTAVLLDTSGTTGHSKLVERTHYSLIGSIAQVLQHYNLRARHNEIIFCNYRFCGMGYLMYGMTIPLKARYKSIFPAPVDTDTFIHTVETMKPTWVIVPKHLMRDVLLRPGKKSFESVRHVLSGGAIIPFELIDEWQTAFGGDRHVQVQSVWGMSEAGFFTIPRPDEPVQDNTTGVLLPNVEAKVLDEDENMLSTNQKGNLYIRTPFVMKGYLGEPVKTAETVLDDGWIRTDDVGWVDEKERVYIVGRRKDIFKVSSYTVTSSEIETAILRHPGVRDVAVIPVSLPNELEAVPRGYMVRTAESETTLTTDDFTSWMQKEVNPDLQLTGGVSFIGSIPITAGGNSKVDRQKLAQIAEKEMHGVTDRM